MRLGFRLRAIFVAAFVLASICALDCAGPTPCQHNSDCAVGYYCSTTQEKCVRNCVDATRDCEPGQICDVNGQCATPSGDAGVPDVATQDAPTQDAPAQETSTQDAPVDVTPGDGAPPATKHELDLCANDSECVSGLICRALYQGGPSRCTPTCATTCNRAAARCVTHGADTFCVDTDVGRTCAAASDCNYGCLTPGGYCTMTCTSGADCPNGFGCATVGQNGKLCVRAEEYCGGANNCTLDCDTSLVASSCTLPCSSDSDCPQRASVLAKWTCNVTCQRPSDVYGPIGQGDVASYACSFSNQEVNLCSDAQHIDFTQLTIPNPPAVTCPASQSVDGASGDACVDTCRYAGGCAHGYECTGIGDISNTRVGLCMPAHGSGEVGGACSTDGDCAFGYCSSSQCSRDCSGDGICPTGSTCTAVGGAYPTVEGVAFKRCQ
ncbi:MAG TPA: hypothetical protein VGH28_04035 [Polyangiaceae bacterium]